MQWTASTDRFDKAKCLKHDASRKNYLLIGDSHAAHLWQGLSTAFPDVNFQAATATGCRPLLGAEGKQTKPTCTELVKFLFSDYLMHAKLDGVILAAAWKDFELARIGPTLDFLHQHGITVIVFGPIVMYDHSLPELMITGMLRGDTGFVARHRSEDQRLMDEKMAQATAGHGATFVSLQHLLCDHGGCLERSDDGTPLQFDYGHLTRAGAETVARRLREKEVIR